MSRPREGAPRPRIHGAAGGESKVSVGGTIEQALPSALYRVKLDDGHTVVAGIAIEARRSLVKVLPGDRVEVAPSPFDPTRGKIIGRKGWNPEGRCNVEESVRAREESLLLSIEIRSRPAIFGEMKRRVL